MYVHKENTHFERRIAMKGKNFGIEIEFTGITRDKTSKILVEHFGGKRREQSNGYKIIIPDGREWQVVYDGSLRCQKRQGGRRVAATRAYSVEIVSPILKYENDIEQLQELVRKVRKAGGFTNNTCGIHIHLDGADQTPTSLRNFINIIHSRNDLLYSSLEIEPNRVRYCKALDQELVERMKKKRPTTFEEIEELWYHGYYQGRGSRYHDSRYHFLNLHSFFNGVGTVELRGFNATLHAGKIRAYILLALGINNQALTQKSASSKKPQMKNPKFAMRTWLNRIGFIGEEYKNPRKHLIQHLEGSAAWRFTEAN